MNLKEIKGRIKAVRKTGSITKAMQNIALSKLKSATDIHEHALTYDASFDNLNQIVFRHLSEGSPYMGEPRGPITLYVIVASDRGLAGPYHNHLFKSMDAIMNDDEHHIFLPIGKKGFQFVDKKGLRNVMSKPMMNRDNIMTFGYHELSALILKLYDEGVFDQVSIVYNKHHTLTEHQATIQRILPIQVDTQNKLETHIFEQPVETIAKNMLANYIQSQLLLSLANAKLSEHSSRMIAMKNATDNAKEIASKLEIQYHRARQQAITEELIDVINGSNV